MNSGGHPYTIMSFKNLLRVGTKQSKGLWVLGKKAKMTKSFSMALAETGILGFIESGLGKKGESRLSAAVPGSDRVSTLPGLGRVSNQRCSPCQPQPVQTWVLPVRLPSSNLTSVDSHRVNWDFTLLSTE